MSLAKVKEHWRFLAKALAIFLLVIIGGPVVMTAFFWIVLGSVDLSTGAGLLLGVGAVVTFVLGWGALVLWFGARSERRPALDDPRDAENIFG